MSIYVAALLIGVVAGMRAFVAPAAVSWYARYGHGSQFVGGWQSFMSNIWVVGAFSLLTLVEFVTDQLPGTPSRKVPKQFIPRLVSGGFCGAVVGATQDVALGCALVGVVGAVLGTFGGFEFRKRLVQATGGSDRPIAVLEDVLAVVIAGIAVAMI